MDKLLGIAGTKAKKAALDAAFGVCLFVCSSEVA